VFVQSISNPRRHGQLERQVAGKRTYRIGLPEEKRTTPRSIQLGSRSGHDHQTERSAVASTRLAQPTTFESRPVARRGRQPVAPAAPTVPATLVLDEKRLEELARHLIQALLPQEPESGPAWGVGVSSGASRSSPRCGPSCTAPRGSSRKREP
jgi:hypothetical protein